MALRALSAEGVWKEFRVGEALGRPDTFYELLARTLKSPFERWRSLGGQLEESERFWALRDVSFQVEPGEVVGVIGRNGAGKSTLLKILSRITAPTRGRIEVRGRLASLLEVGTGFHAELSGRENIYLNATILGMGQREIDRKFDEIVEFSGVGRFLDTPVKRYSSGMYVRLAFAVAAHVEADILLVDEVLAVGDAEFQKRCLGKMEEVASTGRAVMFVSHNLTAIRSLCTKGIVLDRGELAHIGSVDTALELYADDGGGAASERFLCPPTVGADRAYLSRVAVQTGGPGSEGRISSASPIIVSVDVEVVVTGNIDAFIHCYDEHQTMVFSSGSFFDKSCHAGPLSPGRHRFDCEIPAFLLNDGSYSIDVMLIQGRKEVFVSEPSVLHFRVEDEFPVIDGWHWRPRGVIRPNLRWRHCIM